MTTRKKKRQYQCPTCGQGVGVTPIEPPVCYHGTKSNRPAKQMEETST